MLHDVVDWRSQQAAERGIGKVLMSVATVASVAGTMSTLFRPFSLQTAALAVILLAALTVTRLLLRERRMVLRDRTMLAKLVSEYCKIIEGQANVKLLFTDWDQTVVINPQGDVTVKRRIRVTPLGAELHFLRLDLQYYGLSPLSSRQRGRVRATAREVSLGGVTGARLSCVSLWRGDSEHRLLVHFDPPVAVGRETTLEAQWEWPLYSAGLMQGGVEDFDVKFHYAAEAATHRVVILKHSRSDRFAASGIEIPSFENHDFETMYEATFRVEHPELGERYGVRIDKTA